MATANLGTAAENVVKQSLLRIGRSLAASTQEGAVAWSCERTERGLAATENRYTTTLANGDKFELFNYQWLNLRHVTLTRNSDTAGAAYSYFQGDIHQLLSAIEPQIEAASAAADAAPR